jgi:hypothetical protein
LDQGDCPGNVNPHVSHPGAEGMEGGRAISSKESDQRGIIDGHLMTCSTDHKSLQIFVFELIIGNGMKEDS